MSNNIIDLNELYISGMYRLFFVKSQADKDTAEGEQHHG